MNKKGIKKINKARLSVILSEPKKVLNISNFFLLFALVSLLVINQIIIFNTNEALGISEGFFKKITNTLLSTDKKISTNGIKLSGNITDDTVKLVVSEGIPSVYGEELGVSFAQVQQAINILIKFDPTYGKEKITLSGDNLQRYINIGLKISCEYCCGAKSIITNDGQAACGCAHSQAMRGLAAYLIKNHGTEYSDDEILKELARWKGMFFPKQMIKKLASQLQGTDFTPDTASLVLNVDLPDYGKRNKQAPLPSDIENLPSMVGGC